jgi:hypothetical protein
LNKVERYESMFRQATPLFLLGLLLAVVFEPWVPGFAWLRANFGETIVLRLALAFLVGYVLLLWGESLRLHGLFSGVLQAFKQFDRDRAGGASGPAAAEAPSRNPKVRHEAAKLLIAAMRSGDQEIRATSHHNLVRLVGEDFGDDPDAWQRWLDDSTNT